MEKGRLKKALIMVDKKQWREFRRWCANNDISMSKKISELIRLGTGIESAQPGNVGEKEGPGADKKENLGFTTSSAVRKGEKQIEEEMQRIQELSRQEEYDANMLPGGYQGG